MTPRSMAGAWIAALVIAAVAVATLVHAAVLKPPPFAPGTAVIFIGSSLTRNAIPFGPVAGGVLGDGQTHERWSAAAVTEERTLDLLERALGTSAGLILVEFNAFTVDTSAETSEKSQGLSGLVNARVLDFSEMLENGFQSLQGKPASTVHPADPDLAPVSWQVTDKLRRVQMPDAFREPENRERLDSLLQRAASLGKEIVFYEPPRSDSMIAAMGPEKTAEMISHMKRVAQELDRPLIQFGPAWPDALFRDPVHLNAAGRARFLSELPAKFRAITP